MNKKLAASATAVAASAALLFGGVAPATAAPVQVPTATAVTPTLGVAAGSYVYWCNMWGYFCKKAKRIQNWGSFESVCSDWLCTRFVYSKKHPKPYQIKKISAVRYY